MLFKTKTFTIFAAMFARCFFVSLVLILCPVLAVSKVNADSLLRASMKCKGELKDTLVIDRLNDLSVKFRKKGKYDTAYILAVRARDLALPFTRSADNKIANKGKKEVSYAFISIGNIYLDQSKFPEALRLYFKALELKEQIGDASGIAVCLNNIGNIFDDMDNPSEAIRYYEQAKEINERNGNKNYLSKNLNNIGGIYVKLKKYDEALSNYMASMKLKKETNDKLGVALLFNNIGDIHMIRGQFEEAVKNYSLALDIQSQLSDRKGIAGTRINLAEAYLVHRDIGKARICVEEALKIALPLQLKEEIKSSYESLAVIDSLKSDFKSSNLYYHLYISYRDSLQNEEMSKQVLEQKMQFDFDKKEALAKLEEEKRNELMRQEFRRQKQLRNFFLAGFILVLLMAAYVFYAYLQKRKNNRLLETKNLIIEQKQKEILDSIHYAKRIQTSSLPGEKFIERIIRDMKSSGKKP